MTKNTGKRIGAIVGTCMLALLGLAGLLIAYLMPKMTGTDTLNENNTVEYEAIIESVEKTQEGYSIYLNDYECVLLVKSRLLAQDEDLSGLPTGAHISFRVKWLYTNPLTRPEVKSISICSLTVEGEDIIPLSRANDWNIKEVKNMQTMTIILFIIFIVIGITICTVVFLKTKNNPVSVTPEADS